MNAPSYKTHDPKGWCGDPKRGAAMGRGSKHASDTSAEIKFYLREVRLDSGGYDTNGTYFGWHQRLYWYADAEGKVDATLRASNRVEAIDTIRTEYPRAKFFGKAVAK